LQQVVTQRTSPLGFRRWDWGRWAMVGVLAADSQPELPEAELERVPDLGTGASLRSKCWGGADGRRPPQGAAQPHSQTQRPRLRPHVDLKPPLLRRHAHQILTHQIPEPIINHLHRQRHHVTPQNLTPVS
jgi:hypothetical protein